MFVTIKKNETLAGVRDRLAGNKATNDERLRLEELIVKVNSDLDFANLPVGTVVTIPDSPLVRDVGDNPAIGILGELERDLLEGLKEVAAEVDEGAKREIETIAATQKFLGSAAARVLTSDRTIAALLPAAKKQMAARAKEVGGTGGEVDELRKQIRKDFAELRDALDQ